MKVFTGTAVLLSLLVVAAASPADVTNETSSEDNLMEMKREWLSELSTMEGKDAYHCVCVKARP